MWKTSCVVYKILYIFNLKIIITMLWMRVVKILKHGDPEKHVDLQTQQILKKICPLKSTA